MSDFLEPLEPAFVVLVLVVVLVSAFWDKKMSPRWYTAPVCFALVAEIVARHFEFAGWDRGLIILAMYLGLAGVPSLLRAREASPANP
jgi:hypothetical protein